VKHPKSKGITCLLPEANISLYAFFEKYPQHIDVNGRPIVARSVTNRVKETGYYLSDDGTRIKHDPKDGIVRLAIKALEAVKEI